MVARPRTPLSLQHAALVVLAALLSSGSAAAEEAASSCPALLQAHKEKHPKEASPLSNVDGQQQMLYFLHVPRTAGRTFHGCFLKLGTQPHKRCPKGYDHLRMDMSAPGCAMLSTHDDFSIVSLLPSDVAVLTHLRDPVDRVLSAYEFAVEVGSRHASRPATLRKAANKIATDEVWPWSSLVPFIAEDVRRRRAAPASSTSSPPIQPHHWVHVTHPDGSQYYYNKYKDISKWNLTAEEQQHLLPPLNPYDNDLVISLKDFVEHPIAQELLHNGQVFQVLGITNYSHWDDASMMRRCFWQDAHTQEELSKLAQARISRFSHVGVTDKLTESVTSAAVSLNLALDGAAWGQSPQDRQAGMRAAPLRGGRAGGGGGGDGEGGFFGRGMGLGRGGAGGGGEEGARGGLGMARRRARRRGAGGPQGLNRGFWGMGQQRQLLEEYEEDTGAGEGDEGEFYVDEGEAGYAGGAKGDPVPAGSAAARLVVARRELQAAQQQLQKAQPGAAAEEPNPLHARMQELQQELREMEAQVRQSQDASEELEDEDDDTYSGSRSSSGSARKLEQESSQGARKLAMPLGVEYQRCAKRAQERNGQRRINSLSQLSAPDGRFVMFSREARKSIPASIIDYIKARNAADVELHRHATQLLQERRAKHVAEGKLQDLPPAGPAPLVQNPLPLKPFKIPKPEQQGTHQPSGARGQRNM